MEFIIIIILMVGLIDLEKIRKQNNKVIELNEKQVDQNEKIITLLEGRNGEKL